MSKKKTPDTDTIKKNTAFTMAAVCLLVGFLGGIVVSAVKSSSQSPFAGHSHTPAVPDRSDEIAAMKAETARQPNNADVWIQLGHLYFDTGQLDDAVATYRKALELDPDNANVWTDLGVMYRRQGKPQKAVEAFIKAAAIDPKHEIARFNLGIVRLHDLEDPKGAVAAWEELLKINPLAVSPSGQSVDSIVMQLKKQGQP